jgi:chemotaxis protein MotB
VQHLVSNGASPQRLVAVDFGEFQSVDTDRTEEAFSHNRRIEVRLTEH